MCVCVPLVSLVFLFLVSLRPMMHIIASASLQSRVKREPACPTEQMPEVKPQAFFLARESGWGSFPRW